MRAGELARLSLAAALGLSALLLSQAAGFATVRLGNPVGGCAPLSAQRLQICPLSFEASAGRPGTFTIALGFAIPCLLGGAPSATPVRVGWGDGTSPSRAVLAQPRCVEARRRVVASPLRARHTYARRGTYSVTIASLPAGARRPGGGRCGASGSPLPAGAGAAGCEQLTIRSTALVRR